MGLYQEASQAIQTLVVVESANDFFWRAGWFPYNVSFVGSSDEFAHPVVRVQEA